MVAVASTLLPASMISKLKDAVSSPCKTLGIVLLMVSSTRALAEISTLAFASVSKPSDAFSVAISDSVPLVMMGPGTDTVLLNTTELSPLCVTETQMTSPVVAVPST